MNSPRPDEQRLPGKEASALKIQTWQLSTVSGTNNWGLGQPRRTTMRRKANNCVRRALKNCWAFVLTARFDKTTKRSATTNSKRCNDTGMGVGEVRKGVGKRGRVTRYPNSRLNILIVSCGACKDEKDTRTTKGIRETTTIDPKWGV